MDQGVGGAWPSVWAPQHESRLSLWRIAHVCPPPTANVRVTDKTFPGAHTLEVRYRTVTDVTAGILDVSVNGAPAAPAYLYHTGGGWAWSTVKPYEFVDGDNTLVFSRAGSTPNDRVDLDAVHVYDP